MKLFIFVIFVIHCKYFVLASKVFRRGENSNVLVPDNNANIHANIKNLLHNGDIELSDNDLIKYPFIKRILHLDNYGEIFVDHDDVNPQYEIANQNYHDVKLPSLQETSLKPLIQPTPPPLTTITTPTPNPSATEECLFGIPNSNINWVDEKGKLTTSFIKNDDEMKNLKILDFSYVLTETYIDFQSFTKDPYNMLLFMELQVLSLAYNNFNQLPQVLLDPSTGTLNYLSFAGNDFKNLDVFKPALYLPNLLQLDLRNCRLKTMWENFLKPLEKLQHLYLSYNNIMTLQDFPFSSLVVLDLSFNEEEKISDDTPNRMRIPEAAFINLKNLQFLDLSHTKLEIKSVTALTRLSSSVIGISLCYSDLTFTGQRFLSNLIKIKYLDISGNPQLNFTRTMFNDISRTLIRLDARDSNVRNLDWAQPLTNLKSLNLKDNKIHELDNSSFSLMLNLEDLNLEKNSIGNWFSRLFTQNQKLTTLNLRENTLSQLSTEMIDDLLSVKFLSLGNNKFECSCDLQQFMHALFESTKRTNVSSYENDLENLSKDKQTQIEATTAQTVLLGVRRDSYPEYDIISRVYEKYYDQLTHSIEALRKNDYKIKSLISLSELSPLSSNAVTNNLQTILLDYDENNEVYQCMNITEKQKQLLLELIDMCTYNTPDKSPYSEMSDAAIMALSTSIPTLLIISVLLLFTYWKWWHIRYFCVLCKNSAILTFMDDSDGGKETIVRRYSSHDNFLYDVFVSYSDSNRNFVLNEFIPNIEQRESINVCLHERDFQVGFGILENIVSCMDRSKCLLLLISQNFLESQWCQFEMNLAQHRLLETRREKLIMVFLEEIPIKKQPKILKYLMRTKTYIIWPENGSESEKQLFWKRLKKSIICGNWESLNYGVQ